MRTIFALDSDEYWNLRKSGVQWHWYYQGGIMDLRWGFLQAIKEGLYEKV